MYLFYVGDKTMNTVSSAYIIPETYPCPNIAFFNVPYVGPIQEGLHAGLDSLSINYDDKTKRSMQDFKSNDFYIAKKIISTFQVAKSKDPEMTTVCTNEKANIISLVNNFENFQMKKDAKDVLALFTSPIVENDISTYNNLLGLGKNPDSNYLYSQTSNFSAVNFSELSYGILNNNPVYDQDNGCLVYATEERTTTLPASVNLPWGMDTTFDVVKQDNIWKIDKYYNTGTGISKYGGWDETL